MNVFFLIIALPPFLFAITCILDKHLVKDFRPAPLMAIGGTFNLLISGLLFGVIWVCGYSIDWVNFSFLLLNGAFYVVSTWVYLKVVQKEEPTRAVPFFQFMPIFGLLGGFILLKEKIGGFQVFAIFVLMSGGLVLSIKDGVVKKRMAFLMIISAGSYALRDVFFAKFARDMELLPALLGDQLGKAIFALGFLFNKKTWHDYSVGIKTKFALQSTNEVLYIAGGLVYDAAKVFVPVAIVEGALASQSLFLLVLATLCTKLFPSFHSEDFVGITKWQKLTGVLLVVIGGTILST